MTLKRATILFWAAIISVVAMAAPSVSLRLPSAVRVGNNFAVTISVSGGEASNPPAAPAIPGCRIIYGPAVTNMYSSQNINGRTSSTSRTDFTYTYKPEQAGKVTVPSISVRVDGKILSTKPTQFVITAGNAPQSNSSNRPVSIDDITTQSSNRPVASNDVFVRIILNKSTAYEQEAIECTIKLYTKYGIEQFFPTKMPSFDGFLIEEVQLQPTLNQREQYNGQTYATAILKKCIIFPQKSGKLTINSGEYDISVVQFDQVGMGYFSVASPTPRKIQVSSNSASIDIKPLPEPVPEGFSGAVGTFAVDARLIGNSFFTGDAASLIYTIKGTGNIKYVKEPKIDFPSEFELYEPKSEFDGGVSGATVTGTMTIDYTFVPESVGEFKIGSDKFIYFDPSTREYKTLTTTPFTLKVGKGSNNERSEIKVKNTDILHIKPGARANYHTGLAVFSWLYWLVYALLSVALVVLIVMYLRNARMAADVTGMRLAKADKVARNRLKMAKASMEGDKREQFYADILAAVWGYLSDKLSIPASQLSRDNIIERLTAFGAPEALIVRIIKVLDTCEIARYTPDASQQPMQIYSETADIFREMERIKPIKK